MFEWNDWKGKDFHGIWKTVELLWFNIVSQCSFLCWSIERVRLVVFTGSYIVGEMSATDLSTIGLAWVKRWLVFNIMHTILDSIERVFLSLNAVFDQYLPSCFLDFQGVKRWSKIIALTENEYLEFQTIGVYGIIVKVIKRSNINIALRKLIFSRSMEDRVKSR